MAERDYRTAPVPSTELPKGIPYIIGNEAAERFSFYGMKTILAVFMTKHLVDSSGNLAVMGDSDAKAYIHLFVASAYFFPILGAILSDWLLGKYRTILLLSIVYCLGHLALALDETRFGLTLGLTLIAIGAGGIKPCVSAHVGDQFGEKNQHRISKVFGWFYFSINLGAFVSSLLTPVLLKRYGPNVAFGVPGGLMLIATWVFWLGRTKFVHIPAGGKAFLKEAFNKDGLRAIRNLAVLYLFVAVFWSLFDQTASAWVLQAESMDRRWLGIDWLSSQIGAVNPILILAFIPLFSYGIYPAVNRVYTLTPLRKVAIGFFMMVPAFAIPAWIESQITGGRIVNYKFAESGDDVAKASLKFTSTFDSSNWPANNLTDGKTDGPGWVSAKKSSAKNLFPLEIVIRLRERKTWKIGTVRLHPNAELKRFLQELAKKKEEKPFSADEVAGCRPREVEIYAGESRVGPWKLMKKDSFGQTGALRKITFSEQTTGYVMVRILSNHGGRFVALGEVEVLSVDKSPPDGAHPLAADVWPNVAASGHRPKIMWQLVAYVILTAAEIMVSITCLEFSYTQAPKKMKSLIMSVYLLAVSAGNALTFIVNKVIPNADGSNKLPGASYYWFFTGLMLGTACVFVIVAQRYRGQTYIQDAEDAEQQPRNSDQP